AAGTLALPGGVVDEVIDNDQVEPTVSVVIYERGGCSPQGVVQTGGGRDIGELAITEVAEQFDPAVKGEQDIRQTVVVDITNRDALVVARHVQTGPRGDILERPVALLAKKLVPLPLGSPRV